MTDYHHPPYFIATYNGFLIVEPVPGGRLRVYSTPNLRVASTWNSFEEAVKAAGFHVPRLYPPDLAYFAILTRPQG